MDYVRKMELFGSIIVIVLAIFWASVVQVHPNWIIRICAFGGLLILSSFVFTYPIIQSVRIYELEQEKLQLSRGQAQ